MGKITEKTGDYIIKYIAQNNRPSWYDPTPEYGLLPQHSGGISGIIGSIVSL